VTGSVAEVLPFLSLSCLPSATPKPSKKEIEKNADSVNTTSRETSHLKKIYEKSSVGIRQKPAHYQEYWSPVALGIVFDVSSRLIDFCCGPD
jgi:hypothetical protein